MAGGTRPSRRHTGPALPAAVTRDRHRSLATRLAAGARGDLGDVERAARATVEALGDRDVLAALYDWRLWARPDQIAPDGVWSTWLVKGGRGSGKTRTGAEWTRSEVYEHGKRRGALVAPTAADARDVMVEGPAGILAICPPWERPKYEPSKRRLTFPNGAICTLYSADEPSRLRGPQHDFAWCDEVAAWRYADAWDQLMFGLRLGQSPRVVATTTPRPVKLIHDLLADPHTVVTHATTYANRANLADRFFDAIIRKYEGTRLGRQELLAEVLTDTPGALWSLDLVERTRVAPQQVPAGFDRIVVAIDPSVSSGEDADECGIVVVGKASDHAYVLEDASAQMAPIEWARTASRVYHAFAADRVVAEVNNGGDLVETQLRVVDPSISYRAVRASRGKHARAEPVAALYEQGRVHHVGAFGRLEDEMSTYVPGLAAASPNRMDALVWAVTDLLLGQPDPAPDNLDPHAWASAYA